MKEIPLSRGFVTVVDDDIYEKYKGLSWWADSYGYAITTTKEGRKNKKNKRLHRLIMDAKPGEVVDHIDGNPMNNLRSNLRVTSQSNNTLNSRPKKNSASQYKGVTWYKAYGNWQCRIVHKGKVHNLGYFESEHDAARMYNFWARELFGEYARLNVIKQ